jgi:hypothetical protein
MRNVLSLVILMACGGGSKVVIDPEDTTIELSGVFSNGSVPIKDALVTPYAIGEPDRPMFTAKDIVAGGSNTINVFKDTPVSLEFFKVNLATLHTAYQAFR